jgi:hypothetical protein
VRVYFAAALAHVLLLSVVSTATPAFAARQTNGVDQCLQTASNINLSTYAQIAVQMWLWVDSFSNTDRLAMELSEDIDNGHTDAFLANSGNSTTGQFSVGMALGSGVYNERSFIQPSGGAWHHIVFNINRGQPGSNEILSVFVDGVSQLLQTEFAGDSTGNFGSYPLNLMARNCASLWLAGRIAEVAIWGGVTLSPADIATLYNNGNGRLATEVGSVTHYWRLLGDASPEPATVGGVNMNVTGATQVTHPFAPTTCRTWIIGGGFGCGMID